MFLFSAARIANRSHSRVAFVGLVVASISLLLCTSALQAANYGQEARSSLAQLQPTGLPTPREANELFRSKLNGSENPIIVALYDHGRTAVYGYGQMSRLDPKVPDRDSVFEIGSVSKVFTGLLLAQMVVNNEVNLNDPIDKYLPVSVPQWDKQKITLLHLATHTSGLPGMPGIKDAATCPIEDIYAALSNCQLRSKPGTTYLYSNFGAGLLGQALVLRAGADSFDSLLMERICKPLGMNDTRVNYDRAELMSRVARCPESSPGKGGTLAGGGAGGIKTTANDMLKFLAAYIEPEKTSFAPAIKLSYRLQWKDDNQHTLGLMWNINSMINKGGDVDGYHSKIVFSPERKLGFFVSRAGTGALMTNPFVARLLSGEASQGAGIVPADAENQESADE